ncbi:MAG: hypothetical protein ACJA1A_003832 [Saprospiraceae bacterium]|jgi:hypothetical protein
MIVGKIMMPKDLKKTLIITNILESRKDESIYKLNNIFLT